ncbi:MAG TPA: hypothetical protein VK753_09645 [Xanthomonadaceae bacterium]|jgi:hypothetical protein|nr:hypothetical protein [Xanthomonadaceae bacterium]
MKSILPICACAALFLSATQSFATTDLPAVGSYGFDLLKNPDQTQCMKLTKALIGQFQKCEITDGSFGGDPVQARDCTVGKHSEYMVYASKAACIKALETEKSNE